MEENKNSVAEEELLTDGGALSELKEENEAELEAPRYVPKNKYEAALYRVYSDEGLSEMLRVSSLVIVALSVYAFFTHCPLSTSACLADPLVE